MYKILILTALIILASFSINAINKKRRKSNYLKAGKKWDGIVKELSQRK